MSESIAIPRRKGKQRLVTTSSDFDTPSSTDDTSPSTSSAASSSVPAHRSMTAVSPSDKPFSTPDKGKTPLKTEGGEVQQTTYRHDRRTSWLSSSISKSEHMTLNIGDDERPRLITCVKASQGFDWNQDIFLPSYMSDRDHQSELEHRQDPVEDIFITEEEAAGMFPQ